MKKMKWSNLLSTKRFTLARNRPEDKSTLETSETRSPYERDYLRILYSDQFRRLSDKTQVFTAPNNSVIHNRLTHTLEVSTIGKSLARMIVLELFNKKLISVDEDLLPQELIDWYQKVYKDICNSESNTLDPVSKKTLFMNSFIDIVGTACLAHDIGNTPFGHAGESAISDSIQKFKTELEDISTLLYNDLLQFDGNSYGLRLLLSRSSMQLTYASIGAFIKYPITVENKASQYSNEKPCPEIYKKAGIFSIDKDNADYILKTLHNIKNTQQSWGRHPLAFIMEAADDIGYVMMDFEDAVRAKIINVSDPIDDNNTPVMDLFYNSLTDFQKKTIEDKYPNIKTIHENKWISFNSNPKNRDILAMIRAYFITNMIGYARDQFILHYETIMSGTYCNSLICENSTTTILTNFHKLKKFSKDYIYGHRAELLLEGSGYAIIENLLDNFLGAELSADTTKKQKHALKILNTECSTYKSAESKQEKVFAIVGFIAGMTDKYAIELFQRINGHIFYGVE